MTPIEIGRVPEEKAVGSSTRTRTGEDINRRDALGLAAGIAAGMAAFNGVAWEADRRSSGS
jgi:hypothetical protein